MLIKKFKKKKLILFLLLASILFIMPVVLLSIKKDKMRIKDDFNIDKITAPNDVYLNESQKEFGYIFKESFINDKNVDESQLTYFEVTDVFGIGYYASSPERKYIQINFSFSCKDNTSACIKNKSMFENNDTQSNVYSASIMAIFCKNKIIDFMLGITININSDFIQDNTLDLE